jgi:hypothetical protein
VPGRLVHIERDSFKEFFMLALPLLRVGFNQSKLLLTSLMRFVCNTCCSNSSHLTNRKDNDFSVSMGEAIGEVKEWL